MWIYIDSLVFVIVHIASYIVKALSEQEPPPHVGPPDWNEKSSNNITSTPPYAFMA
jgi:hypothetical protein